VKVKESCQRQWLSMIMKSGTFISLAYMTEACKVIIASTSCSMQSNPVVDTNIEAKTPKVS
jgi:hypothetical protein